MARGITESDVHIAADELVANGERPTVERIRAHLGTGSPNTVTKWLDTWWKKLGVRLQSKRPDLKDAPAVLAELAGQWWALALEHGRESALEELATARKVLSAEYDELRMQQQNFADEATELHATVAASSQAERIALSQVVELRQLVDQLQSQLAASVQQRSKAEQQLEQMDVARQGLDARLHELQELARSERESLIEHARSVEDRALREIDQIHQGAKDLKAKLASSEKHYVATEKSLTAALKAAQKATAEASQEADKQRARSDVLEEQLAKMPAAIEAALRRKLKPAISRQKKPKS